MSESDRRLIEDYIPLQVLSAEGAREKSVRKGHVSAIHLWWARRPLSASRAAVFAALVGAPDGKNGRGGRSRFIAELCRYPGDPQKIAAAEEQILEAHARRISSTPEDIRAGRAPRPRVLDSFAGGGTIPLEAARLGCDSYAIELNPVAHMIELVTLDYARRYGPALAADLERWGKTIAAKAREEIGDLYPAPHEPRTKRAGKQLRVDGGTDDVDGRAALLPIAYLWTRTVRCKRPDCGESVPLVRQTWLCRKKGRMVALRTEVIRSSKTIRYHVVEARTEGGLGFDPEDGSTGGNATCPFCQSVADEEYVKTEGRAGRLARALIAVVCARAGSQGKVYLSPEAAGRAVFVDDNDIKSRIEKLSMQSELTPPDEPLPENNMRAFVPWGYGLTRWGDLFTPRQLLCLLVFTKHIRRARLEMLAAGFDEDRAKAVTVALTCVLDRLADFNSTMCLFNSTGGRGVRNTFGRGALAMTWDFAETNPFNPKAASWIAGVKDVGLAITKIGQGQTATVLRGSATELPFESNFFDAIVTDPPYYDNIPYSDLSDFFYVWARRAIGDLFPEHFTTPLTPKRREAIAEPSRHGGSKSAARHEYEALMSKAFEEMNRVLKPNAPLVCVYAHKTVAGWSTLIEALRQARFVVVEAWPLDTEKRGRPRDQGSAALASSIFLVARRREGKEIGSYERQVRPDLEAIVRERSETLWKEGVTGADLVIAAVGAGLRAFTRFEKVEYENGEEGPASGFIREVEGAVLDTVLRKVGVRDADPPTKFYLAWRLQYRTAELDAGEAIVFAYPLGVELDGSQGLTAGARALVTKKGSKMRLRDHTERGDQEKLGLPAEDDGEPAPLIDILHRTLWLMDHRPGRLRDFLDKARPDGERLRLVAQALAGTALQGDAASKDAAAATPEQTATGKLTANWRSVFEESLFRGQSR